MSLFLDILEVGLGPLASIWGASKQAGAANSASQASLQAQRESLAFAREQALEEKRRYEEEQARLDAAYAAEQARRAPFRNAALSILGDYGFEIPASAYQTPDRPEDWQPGMSGPQAAPRGVDSTGFGAVRRRTPTTSQTIRSLLERGY